MSYILQALKKSEQERELAAQDSDVINENSTTPDLLNRQFNSQSEKSMPLLVYGWLGVLCILIVLIAGYLYPKATPQQAEPLAVKYVGINEFVVPVVAADKIEVKKVTVQKATVQKVADQKEAMQETIVLEAMKEAAVQQETLSELFISDPPPQLIGPKIAVELAAKDTQSLIPNINISSHIYSSLPARRSIVVNGERLAETDFITPNVQVKEITHQGMIIEVDGLSLVIDRSRGWSR
ncbi:MAG: general secretion pathway protein B [Oleispira sp.]|jgi:general secretion pathway protein B